MRAVVNIATKKYFAGQRRLIASISQSQLNYVEIIWCESDEEYTGNKMYNFKPEAMIYAIERGYKSVLWLDASMVVIKDLSPIFELIESQGYFFQDSGWYNSQWTNEKAKEYFGTDDGQMISSGVLGINFDSLIGQDFFRQWKQAADGGIFNGSHEDHRHDQTCASIIAHKLGMTITPNNTYWNYGKQPFHDNIVILADGIS